MPATPTNNKYEPIGAATKPNAPLLSGAESQPSHQVVFVPGELGPFTISCEKFQSLVDPKSPEELRELGGLEGICKALLVDPTKGLNPSEIFERDEATGTFVPRLGQGLAQDFEARKQIYGINIIPARESESIFHMMLEALKDKTLILLMVAAGLNLAFGIYEDVKPIDPSEDTGPRINFVEGLVILFAVVVVVLVGSINDYNKEKMFKKLNEKKEDRRVNVLRNGEQVQISIFELVVGDVLFLETGEVIPADGILISGSNLKCDESGATGESDAVKKGGEHDQFLLSGTKVLDGVGRMVVIAVGPKSFHGKTLLGLQVEAEETPLQVKLDGLAEMIAKVGLAASILMLLVLILEFIIGTYVVGRYADSGECSTNSTNTTSNSTTTAEPLPLPTAEEVFDTVIAIVIQSLTILVVAVPEGLPMAVTIALAFATTRMLKDNNLVRVLAACETMGGATTICSDKTGTLTQNKMTVVRGRICSRTFDGEGSIPSLHDHLSAPTLKILFESIALNSTAFESFDATGKMVFLGSKTETALLGFLSKLGGDYKELRLNFPAVRVYPFSSERKRMSVVIKHPTEPNMYRIYVKGAAEIILRNCQKILTQGSSVTLEPGIRGTFESLILTYAREALRNICLAYRDIPASEFDALQEDDPAPDHDLTLIGIVGIEDPLRPEVADAVATCQKAGIIVRMVTGDNAVTAKSIASRCGIFSRGGLVMEGPQFRKLSDSEMTEMLPRLQVLARSSPTDKQLLVSKLKSMGETVAVTGDGTNDGPALKLADVGFSMGIAGTEVAKEASSIILMDDNFSSIVKAVMWGRSIFDSVRKFLQFQVTVNLTAVILAFVTAVTSDDSKGVLTAVQLLWVNMLMDTLAALALATDPPTMELLDRPPHTKKEPLINWTMGRMIIVQAAFQIAVNLTLQYKGAFIYRLDPCDSNTKATVRTIIFNTFVFMQLFNEINCRRIDNHLNVFKGFFQNRMFLAIIISTTVLQVVFSQFCGVVFKTVPLSIVQWVSCICIGMLSLPIGLIVRLLPECWSHPDRMKETHPVTKQRMMWDSAIHDVRTQLRVFSALRRQKPRSIMSRSSTSQRASVDVDWEEQRWSNEYRE